MAVRDPAFLFEAEPYLRTGAVVWPDFWNATVAPDFYRLFGLDPSKGPRGSHESGQMLFDKARAWRPLLLALLFNIQGRLYYKLMSDYMGQGDKETFALAFYALRAPLYEARRGRMTPPLSSAVSRVCFLLPLPAFLLLASLTIFQVTTPVGSVGRVVPFIKHGLSCFEPYVDQQTGRLSCFIGNSMMQHIPGKAGRVMGPGKWMKRAFLSFCLATTSSES